MGNLVSMIDGNIIRTSTMFAVTVEDVVNDANSGQGLEGAQDIVDKSNALGVSVYTIVFRAVMIGILCGIIFAGLGLVFSNEQERREKKSKIVWGVAGAAVAVGASAVLIFLAKVIPGFLS